MVSHFHVNVDSNALKRKRGSPRGGGGENSCKRKRSRTRAQKCALFLGQASAQCERRVCSKAPGSKIMKT